MASSAQRPSTLGAAVSEESGTVTHGPCSPLVSELAEEGDPELLEIVADFVASCEARVVAMREQIDVGDLVEVSRIAHQIRGAGGTAGYPLITEAAGALEDGARRHDAAACRAALERLLSLSTRAQAGLVKAVA